MDGTRIAYNWKGRGFALLLAGFVLGFAAAILASGLRTGEWLLVGGAVVFVGVALATPLRSLIARPFRPAFVATASGLRLDGGALVPWRDVKEAVFFNHSGSPHFGIRLKDGVAAIGREKLVRVKESNLDYFIYRMPFVSMTSMLAATPDELTKLFRKYGVPIRVNKVLVDVGEEERI